MVQEIIPKGRIKIGFTRRRVDLRMAELRGIYPLRVLATQVGGRKLERSLHERFFYARIQGEWFKPVKELVDYCNEIGVDMAIEPQNPGRKSRTISINDDDWKSLTELAEKEGRTRSSMIISLVRKEVARLADA